MKRRLVEDLVCPLSSHPLAARETRAARRSRPASSSAPAAARWPIRDGVPRLVPPDLVEQQRRDGCRVRLAVAALRGACTRSSRRSSSTGCIRSSRDFFRGKRVLDAGCGTGRHAYFAAPYGASEVVALDLSDAVETRAPEPRAVRQRPGRAGRSPAAAVPHGCRGRRLRPRLLDRRAPPPARSVRRASARCSGTCAPAGRSPSGCTATRTTASSATSSSRCAASRRRMPPPLLRGLAWPLGVGIPRRREGRLPAARTERRVGRALPLDEYMASVADFSFRQNYGIVFDQLVAPTAAYIKGPELRELVRGERARGRRHLPPPRQLLARPGPRAGLTMAVNDDLHALPSCSLPSSSALIETGALTGGCRTEPSSRAFHALDGRQRYPQEPSSTESSTTRARRPTRYDSTRETAGRRPIAVQGSWQLR